MTPALVALRVHTRKTPERHKRDPVMTPVQQVIVYPKDACKNPTGCFPLLSYAHGAAGGGWYTFEGYYALWRQIASFGYVGVAVNVESTLCVTAFGGY